MEETDAQDAVCDGPDDKGVDGIYVDANLERIEILQSKLFQNSNKTLGDTSLKEFAGTLDQFSTPAPIARLVSSTTNPELARLIVEAHIGQLIQDGYEVRGVFVTNARRDLNAGSYLTSRPDVTVYDAETLAKGYVPTGPSSPVVTPVSFDITGYDPIEYRTSEAKAVVAPRASAAKRRRC